MIIFLQGTPYITIDDNSMSQTIGHIFTEIIAEAPAIECDTNDKITLITNYNVVVTRSPTPYYCMPRHLGSFYFET